MAMSNTIGYSGVQFPVGLALAPHGGGCPITADSHFVGVVRMGEVDRVDSGGKR